MSNQDKISTLAPLVGRKAQKVIERCKKELGIELLITCGYRSISEQDALYAQGRTKAGARVTNAKGGQSFHNYRVAIDVCPVQGGKLLWNYDFKKIGKIGKEEGFVWGGDFKSILDMPHFELTLGYGLADFQSGKINWQKYK